MVGRLVKKVKKYQDWIFDSIFLKDESPVEKENLNFLGEKPKFGCLWILFEFIEDWSARKIDF